MADGFPKLVLSLLNMAYELVLALYHDIKIALYLYLNCWMGRIVVVVNIVNIVIVVAVIVCAQQYSIICYKNDVRN